MFRETNVRPSAYNLNPMNEPGHQIEISVVVPIFREAESVEPLCRRLIPVLDEVASSFEVLFVDEDPIRAAMTMIERSTDRRVEAAGAAGLAGLLTQPGRWRGRRVAVPICGGNRDGD